MFFFLEKVFRRCLGWFSRFCWALSRCAWALSRFIVWAVPRSVLALSSALSLSLLALSSALFLSLPRETAAHDGGRVYQVWSEELGKIKAPMVKACDAKAKREFTVAYLDYVDAINEARHRGENLQPKSVRECVPAAFLAFVYQWYNLEDTMWQYIL